MLAIRVMLLLAWSCGAPKGNVAPELEPFWAGFSEAKAYAWSVPGGFVDSLEGDTVGECTFQTDFLGGRHFAKVVFLRSAWDKYSETEREVLVWHELGHCVLGLGHDARVDVDGPVSIMYPNVFKPTGSKLNVLKEEL